jgi:hypothetical protein
VPYLLMDGSKYQEKESQEISPRSASYATEPMMKDQLPTQVAAQPAPVASPATKPPTPEVNAAPMPVSAGGVSGKSLPQVMTGISQTLPRPGTQSKVVTAEDRSSANRERVLKMSNRVVTDKIAAQRLLEHATQSSKTQARSLFKFAAADYDVEYAPEYAQEVPQEEYMPQYEQAAVQNYYPGYDAYSNYMSYSPSSQQMYYSPAAASADFKSYENMYATPEPSAQADYAPMEEAAPAPAPAPAPEPQPTEEELQLATQEVERQQMVQAYQQSLSEIMQYLVNVGYPPEEAAKYAPTLLGQVGITNPAQVKTASRFNIARPGLIRGAAHSIGDFLGFGVRKNFVEKAVQDAVKGDKSYKALQKLVNRQAQIAAAEKALAAELGATKSGLNRALRAEAVANATEQEARLLQQLEADAARLGLGARGNVYRASGQPVNRVLQNRSASTVNEAIENAVTEGMNTLSVRSANLTDELSRLRQNIRGTRGEAQRALQLRATRVEQEIRAINDRLSGAGRQTTIAELRAQAENALRRDIAIASGVDPREAARLQERISRTRGELREAQDLISSGGPTGQELANIRLGRRQRFLAQQEAEGRAAQKEIDKLIDEAGAQANEVFEEGLGRGQILGTLVGIPALGGAAYGLSSYLGYDPQSPTDKVFNTASNLLNDPVDTAYELGSSAGSAISSGYQKAKNMGQSVADYATDKGLTSKNVLDWADKNKEDLLLAGLTVGGIGLGASALSRRGKSSPAPGQGPSAPASSPTRIW